MNEVPPTGPGAEPGAEHPGEAAEPIAADSAARNVGYSFAYRILGALFTAALTLVLVRKLGPGDYGVFALALSLATILLFVADAGLATSAGRFIAENRHDRGSAAAVYRDALALKLAAAVLVAVALFALASPIADAYGIDALVWPLRLMALAVLGQSLLKLSFSTFEATGRIALTLRLALAESAIETAASIALVLAGAGAAGAAAGRAAGYVVAAAFGIVLVAARLRLGVRRGAGAGTRWRRIARYALALAAVDAAFVLFDRLDVLLIGAYLDAEAAGIFEAPLKFIVLLQYFAAALAGGVAPGLAASVRGAAEVRRFVGATRLLIVFQAALLAPTIVWAEPIVSLLLGDAYGESVPVLRALAPFMFLFGMATLLTLGVNYMGFARRRIPIAVAALAINVVVDVILIPRIGPIAGAVGSGAAFAIYVPAHVWILRRELGLRLGPLLASLLRSLVAAAAMAAVLYAVGTSDLSPLGWIAGGAGGIAAYLGTLLVLRESDGEELRLLGRKARGALGRGG